MRQASRIALLAVWFFVLAGATQAQELTAPKRHATAVRLEGQVTLDGKLDDAAWQKAPEQTGYEMPLGQAKRQPIPPDTQTHFRVLYDDQNLYFGIRCDEPKMKNLTVQAARQHDAAMWSDDDVELFLDPVGDRMEYYQLTVNSEGTQVDLYMIERGNTGKAGWSSEWQTAAYRGDNYWSLEIAIPFALLHNRPAQTWTDNWGFSISRTRTPEPRYYSQYSPAKGYHDVVNFGTLGPIKIDRSRYNLYAEAPRYRLESTGSGYNVYASLQLQNRGEAAFDGTLEMEIGAEGSAVVKAPLQLAGKSSARLELPVTSLVKQGKWPVFFRARAAAGYLALDIRFDDWLNYTPLTITLSKPSYRNSIYETQQVDNLIGKVKLGLPLDKLTGLIVRVSLTSSLSAARSVDLKAEATELAFQLPASDLPVGDHRVRAELLRPLGDPAKPNTKMELVEESEIVLRKLPAAPVIETRVDEQGNLLINGQPIFIRGWYGSMSYIVSAASFPAAQLPHSTNFMMGASDFEKTDLALYSLAGVTGLIDEAKAKLDQPIDDQLRAKLRETVAQTRLQRNVVGYYISDEPECRGLSPVFLKSLWQFLAQEDPYRFCMIVSRDPETYINSCDVMCPHPYLSPQQYDDGSRKFASDLRHIHNVISAASAANDGSKAVWSMPQTFTYGGLHGRNPNFRESRWFAYTSLANGAKGLVPFIFDGYWNHWPSRVGMSYVFEELTFLAQPWSARNTATEASCDNPQVDVIAKVYRPQGAVRAHTYIITANQSYEAAKATITVPALAKNRNTRLLVLRENRAVPVVDGKFTDQFAGLGVHVYTTLEILPAFKNLDEIEAEIAAPLQAAQRAGNLLALDKVHWNIGEEGLAFQSDTDLADGIADAAAWMPVYSDRTQCVINFDRPLTFGRVVLSSPTIKAADLDIWVNGQWQTIHQWQEQYLPRLEWSGKAVTTTRLRIKPTAQRDGYGSWAYNEITELGLYAK